jgi:osmotically-inducible protein OsmY
MHIHRSVDRGRIALGLATALLLATAAPVLANRTCEDAAITGAMRDRMRAAKLVNAPYWYVDTRDGVVYVFGATKSPYDIERVERLAMTLPGVRRVVAILDVGPYVWLIPNY